MPVKLDAEAETAKPLVGEPSSPYQPHDDGAFEFIDYTSLPVFCSFLPGIAGSDGTPLWAMYVNRGQGIISFGLRDKDHPVAEFLPATWAWQLAPLQGFRTFLRVDSAFWEPFVPDAGGNSRRMLVQRHSLAVQDADSTTGLSISVEYATSARTTTAALLRTVRIRNNGTRVRHLEGLDGLPVIAPSGLSDFGLKKLRRIMEAFCRVAFDNSGTALFSPPASVTDSAEVTDVKELTFYAARLLVGGARRTLPLVIDPDRVFGAGNDLLRPRAFLADANFSPDPQTPFNRLPSALAHFRVRLEPGEEIRLDALAGYARSPRAAAAFVAAHAGATDALRSAARAVVDEAVAPALAATALRELDGYILQNHLDNVLRGGRPVLLPSLAGPVPVHLYARRHGDLERDYNDFQLPPWPLSEGSGNYRDILQNRRNDTWFHPEIGDAEIRSFVELLQPDGYNPLSIEGYHWQLPGGVQPSTLLPAGVHPAAGNSLANIVSRPFVPGELLRWADEADVPPSEREPWMHRVLAQCEATLGAVASHEGYWIDHWIYLLDMIEAFQAVHPDKLAATLFEKNFRWFPCRHRLVPLDDALPRRHRLEPLANPVDLPPSPLFARLAALAAVKFLTLDREGRGIEMEAGRPGWDDAMNGLPNIGGSSTCETAELLRLCRWLAAHHDAAPAFLPLPGVVAAMIRQARIVASGPWNYPAAVSARESFRAELCAGNGAQPDSVPLQDLLATLDAIAVRCADGIGRSRCPDSHLLHTFFIHDGAGTTRPLPLFLEGQVHYLRLDEGRRNAHALHEALRKSPLFDRPLAMYRLNASLAELPHTIGRARTFTPGVYENESIWLHMSMKYLVELLRCGLHDEFFHDAGTMLVPFMDPAVYGRSIYENSSFIAASCCPEAAIRGRGFVARLSGSTAEFIHIWRLLTVGENPFRLDAGELVFSPQPVLPAAWFRKAPSTLRLGTIQHDLPADCLACTLPSGTLLVYRNPHRANTWGTGAVRPDTVTLDGGDEQLVATLRGDLAHRLRAGGVRRIDVNLQPGL